MTPLRNRLTPWLYTPLNLMAWPADWTQQLRGSSLSLGSAVQVKGRGPGSLEDEATAGLDYTVITGERIRDGLPWLYEWYMSPDTLREMEDLAGEPLQVSPHLQSAINVNILRGPGGRYEWHTDAQPYTLLIFASTLREEEGGALQLGDMSAPDKVLPQVGCGVFFDGSAVPHAVEQLRSTSYRISIPVVFLPRGATLQRDAGLDGYLFTGEGAR